MRAPIAALFVTVAVLSATGLARAQESTVAIDVAHSRARFAITHLYLQRVTGSVPIAAGTVVFAAGSPVPARVSATLDPRHIDTGNGDRDEDLQGPDWFDTRKFPAWTFASTAIAPGSGGTFVIEGTLTIHGVAQPVTLTVTPGTASGHATYHAAGKVDRHGFGMPLTAIDGLLGGNVDLTLDVSLAK
jgi:polyisoprenoid-binding protein YceI